MTKERCPHRLRRHGLACLRPPVLKRYKDEGTKSLFAWTPARPAAISATWTAYDLANRLGLDLEEILR